MVANRRDNRRAFQRSDPDGGRPDSTKTREALTKAAQEPPSFEVQPMNPPRSTPDRGRGRVTVEYYMPDGSIRVFEQGLDEHGKPIRG